MESAGQGGLFSTFSKKDNCLKNSNKAIARKYSSSPFIIRAYIDLFQFVIVIAIVFVFVFVMEHVFPFHKWVVNAALRKRLFAISLYYMIYTTILIDVIYDLEKQNKKVQ